MRELLLKYERKLVEAGLADEGSPVMGGLDAEIEWNRDDPLCAELAGVFEGLEINSLLYSVPAEPYRSIVSHLAARCDGESIRPADCETRTFLHDLPVVRVFDAKEMIRRLRVRKCVVTREGGILTWGTVSPEQAFIFFSSVCFSCFVKFFTDFAYDLKEGKAGDEARSLFDRAAGLLDPLPEGPSVPPLRRGPLTTPDEVVAAIAEVGRETVSRRLVDSFFGNVSYLLDGVLYISQTTSSLDELEGCIDPCPLDGSSCASITASSEYTAHVEALGAPGVNGILHGHPKFSVIMSMLCDREDCGLRGRCHVECDEKRFVGDVPVVPGEVGTGPTGLCRTLPGALRGSRGAIVWGHGLFTKAGIDFNEAFANLCGIEAMSRRLYLERVADLL
jgi:ribulose-5-phosphate 4-epimerase/fuculose-1-phosphate aldolase